MQRGEEQGVDDSRDRRVWARQGHLGLLVGQEEPTATDFQKELNWRGWGWGRVTGREKRGPTRYLGGTTTEPS